MNIAICDDEKVWQDELKNYLYDYKQERNTDIFINCFSDGSSCSEASLENYDIIFMDYQMKDINGVETARRIRETNSDSTIIFVSAFPQVAMDTFEVNTFRFLTKPIKKDKLFKAIDDYISQTLADNFIVIKEHERTLRLKISDIIYIEAFGSHSFIHTVKHDYNVSRNLKEIEKLLPDDRFFRCHKAFLTSFMHIRCHDSTDIYFYDDSRIYISRNMLSKFRKALQNYTVKYDSEGLQ